MMNDQKKRIQTDGAIIRKKLMGLAIGSFIFLFIGEIAIRIYDAQTQQNLYKDRIVEDDLLGWTARPNQQIAHQYTDDSGTTHIVEYSTTSQGFKAFGELATNKKKVLFIGDSFTQAVEVSNTKTYYELLRQRLDFELFAFGVSGYGTLQEKMILEKYLPIIQPDLIVLQLCSNDFIDNSYELDLVCDYQINSQRPFMNAEGEIIYQKVMTSMEWWCSHLKFTNFIYWQLIKAYRGLDGFNHGEYYLVQQPDDYPPFLSARSLTQQLLGEVKALVPSSTTLLAFCADDWHPQATIFHQLCQGHQIPYTNAHASILKQAKSSNRNPFARDGVHWNETGHQIVAAALTERLQPMLDQE